MPPLSAPERFCRNRSRPHQLSQGDPRYPDAARHPDSGLVFAAGGGARDPEQVREPARSGAFCPAPPRRSHRDARHRAQAPALGFSLSLLLPAGGCGVRLRRYPRLDIGPDPRRCNGSGPVGLRRQNAAGLDRGNRYWRLSLHCPGDAVLGSAGRGDRAGLLRNQPGQ